ncbi:hypothetical protein [Scopulibacillus darangshiensis]|uniref:hypothetical protein n=1 Tax=Scopulibacillus darangshiensis TaxID=442528 RepID=UPI0010506D9D|nr:hypothetical protein [Scopulibacillus darangshiensis]
MRSVSLHTMRNFIGAAAAPILGWFVYRINAIYYENFRGHFSLADPETNAEMTSVIRHLINSGHSPSEAKVTGKGRSLVKKEKQLQPSAPAEK